MANRRKTGFALISALWLLVLMSVIASALAVSNRQTIQSMAAITGGTQARYLSEGAFQLVYANLLESNPRARLLGDGEIIQMNLPGGTVTLQVSDENGKIDINYAERELLSRLFFSLDMESTKADQLADAILDYRDEDDLRRLNGAEDQDYRAAGLDWEAKDAPFTSTEELKFVLGIDTETFELIQPYITVYTMQRGINPAVAMLPVLAAVSLESPVYLQNYIERRRRSHTDNLPLPSPPRVDSRFLSRTRGLTYSLQAIGESTRGQTAGLTTTIRIRRNRRGAVIQTLEWRPYVANDIFLELSKPALGGGDRGA